MLSYLKILIWIVQGAMAVRVSGANLAASVANAGSVGVISSLGLGLNSPYFNIQSRRGNCFLANQLALINELEQARSLSPNGMIRVNVSVATKDYPVMVRTAVENGANLIITAAGLPLNLPEYTANHPDVALVPMVCGLDAVQTICQTWQEKYDRLPDAFIIENSKAVGRHISTTCEGFDSQIERLIPQIQSYLQHQPQENCLYRDSRKSYCILQALANAACGDVENGLVFSGVNVGRAERILSVAEVMAELTSVQEAVLA